ncbi:chitinase C-terminal domain-containing protein [Motilimonas cestriensis]|uniref:Chitinase C-terminal domain-containing protein n=1 Tax=Motilimonas cestriensis TaxID=2742685 RepID=A0ABS8WAC9_9GAMM|nr:glycosyl hydrolase family 18 protein [Motilimonas cestriensis]MCE2594711.1 chitinase C-terminal domain-containing protein [Motilimonas cestriensis]
MRHSTKASLAKGAFALSTLTSACLLAFNAQAANYDCSDIQTWDSSAVYAAKGTLVQDQGSVFENKWYAGSWDKPAVDASPWANWQFKGECGDNTTVNIIPTVALINVGKLTAGQSARFSATANDEDGQISKVDFFINGSLIGSAASAPYQVNWNTVVGPHELSAIAYDDKGAMSQTAIQQIVVDAEPVDNLKPTLSLSGVTDGAELLIGELVALQVVAQDSDGSIANVQVVVNGVSVDLVPAPDNGTSNKVTYLANFEIANGVNSILVKAEDDKGALVEQGLTVNGKEAVNLAPQVSMSLSTTQAQPGDTVTINATASDSDDGLEKVEFLIDGVTIARFTADTVSDFDSGKYTFDFVATKSAKVTVVATDMKGLSKQQSAFLTLNDGVVGNDCRPDGLYQTPGVKVPYCSVYDDQGREKMGADHPRRVIGYFTSWRNKGNVDQDYLVDDIPWENLTHINYAFAHVGKDQGVGLGQAQQDQLARLVERKMQHDVKVLISVGGWAETGGINGPDGREQTGGFYKLTTNMDGSINHAGIAKFAKSSVDFIRKHKIDGIDIDYEYASAMKGAGHPGDFWISDKLRPHLMASYVELMKVMREELDKASAQDGQHYLLTVAAPASGWLLRGMERYEANAYLDYINIMSYDLHGAWNEYVGHNAALYDTGKDGELAQVYAAQQYGKLGYLNTDWAAHYYRGGMPAGRINIGVPYYTRGWEKVSGGEAGLWGKSKGSNCPAGTHGKCGAGAKGLDNLWHDLEKNQEVPAGSNPMWHAKNLQNNMLGSYLETYANSPDYKGDKAEYEKIVGQYEYYYDNQAVAPWLWNPSTQTFLSMEDKASILTKADYVKDQGIGGIMFWELAGDYSCYPYDAQGKRTTVADKSEAACASGNGEYHMGNTMTETIYEEFKSATPYGNKTIEGSIPAQAVDLKVTLDKQRADYPITTDLIIENNAGVAIDDLVEISFDYPTSAPANAVAGNASTVSIVSGHDGDNIGGLKGDFHRISFSVPKYQAIADGATGKIKFTYNLPITGPVNYTVKIDGVEYALAQEHPDLPLADLCRPEGLSVYPDFVHQDGWKPYNAKGEKMVHNGAIWVPSWGQANTEPSASDSSWTKVCTLK